MSKAKVTRIKVPIEDFLDSRDKSAVLSFQGGAGRCKGGRIILKGYVCPHCGSYDSRNCGKPREAELAKLERGEFR